VQAVSGSVRAREGDQGGNGTVCSNDGLVAEPCGQSGSFISPTPKGVARINPSESASEHDLRSTDRTGISSAEDGTLQYVSGTVDSCGFERDHVKIVNFVNFDANVVQRLPLTNTSILSTSPAIIPSARSVVSRKLVTPTNVGANVH
jgi:hypothetical protein